MNIKTTHINPPIPIRCFDWSAIDSDTYDGALDAPPQKVGYGSTEQEAIEDLQSQTSEVQS